MQANTKQFLVSKENRKELHGLLDQILEVCYIDVLTGKFYCRRCKNVVHIDLSQKLVYCPLHGVLI